MLKAGAGHFGANFLSTCFHGNSHWFPPRNPRRGENAAYTASLQGKRTFEKDTELL